jgi:hypothetical protein
MGLSTKAINQVTTKLFVPHRARFGGWIGSNKTWLKELLFPVADLKWTRLDT